MPQWMTGLPLRIFAAALLLLIARVHATESFPAHVVGVTDGDTITVLDAQHRQRKIRLAGIDAPESKQPFGQASKKNLAAMVFDRDVTLDCGKLDRYHREVCVVVVDGKDANLAQIEAGLAWWYRKYQREQTARQRTDYEAAEAGAKAERRGLWVELSPVPPWEWRRQ